ncbi:MAG: glycoside hydrolase family 16 protein [Capnocytophaga granulosa]
MNMRPFTLLLFTLALMSWGCSKKEEVSEKPWKLVWEDNFDRNDIFSTGVWTKMNRWGDNCCNTMSKDPSLFEIKDGKMILLGVTNKDLKKDPSPYLTAGVWTKEKKFFQKGKIEVRCKLEGTQGAWPAIWLVTKDTKWPEEGGEIDLIERLNYDPFVYHTVHSPFTHKKKAGPKNSTSFPINPDDYNTYAVDFEGDVIRFYVNGLPSFVYSRMPGKESEKQFPFDLPFYLIIDMQLGGEWVGEVKPFDKPVRMYIDWVRFYQR